MDRRDLSAAFRERFRQLVDSEKDSLSQFLSQSGIDRSALSQFLDPRHDRLPRAETLRRIAETSGVSVDWLLCLENAPEGRQEMTTSSQIESEASSDGRAPLEQWHQEAAGHKLRYVPSTLPDMLSLSDITAEERHASDARGGGVENVLKGVDLDDRDIEIAMPLQTLQDLSAGTGLWCGTPKAIRCRQLRHMARLCAASYPAVRLHLYDGSKVFSAPFTVFGRMRAALYLGDAYLSLTSADQIKFFTKRFDHLVRQSIVAPDVVHETLEELAQNMR